MACSSKPSLPLSLSSAAINAVNQTIAPTISTLHHDIIATHILTRLDGPTLASASCVSSRLRALASEQSLWSGICHFTWPSTGSSRMRQVISEFPDGARSFFSDSYPLISSPANFPSNHVRTSEIISAVDVYYRGKLILSRVVETETVTGWFRCSPFRVDLLDPKDTVPTPIVPPEATDDTCRELEDDLTLSWIVVDPAGRRSMNLSSNKPVSVHRHWLTREVRVRFAYVLSGRKGSSSELVECGIVVTCVSGAGGGEMHVREVSLQVENMDGMHLNGRDTLVILQKALEGKRGKGRERKEEGKRRYDEYLERKSKRKDRKMKIEGALDILGVIMAIFIASSGLVFWWR